MLDWKILGAGFVALLLVSVVFTGGFGTTDIFSKILDKINDLFKTSPFKGFVSTPKTKTTEVKFFLYPDKFTLTPSSLIKMKLNGIDMEGFNGDIHIDFKNGTVVFKEHNSPLKISMFISYLTINDLKMDKMIVNDMKFEISPNVTTDNGSIEIYDFSGKGIIGIDNIEFNGNVTRLIAHIGDLDWEIK